MLVKSVVLKQGLKKKNFACCLWVRNFVVVFSQCGEVFHNLCIIHISAFLKFQILNLILGIKPNKGKGEDEEKATDDFHFEKFKKQFRRF